LWAIALVGCASLALERLETTVFGSTVLALAAELVSTLLLVFAFLPLPVIACAIVVRLIRGQRPIHWRPGLLWLALSLLSGSFLWAGIEIHAQGKERVILLGKEICTAIEKYRRSEGHAPPRLENLVPIYLERIPATRVGRFPQFGYVGGEEALRAMRSRWCLFVEVGYSGETITFFPLGSPDKGDHKGEVCEVIQKVDDWRFLLDRDGHPEIRLTPRRP